MLSFFAIYTAKVTKQTLPFREKWLSYFPVSGLFLKFLLPDPDPDNFLPEKRKENFPRGIDINSLNLYRKHNPASSAFLFPIMVQAFRKLPEKMFFAVSTEWILPEKINSILALDFPSPGRSFLFMAELLRFPKLLAAGQHLPLFFLYVFQHKNTAHAIKKDFFYACAVFLIICIIHCEAHQ